MTAKRTLIPALVLAGGLACTASAQAQPYGNAWGYSRGDTRAAFDNGYRSGFDRGRDDARHQRYDYGRHDEYRSANSGYERSYGDRDQYRDTFRRGFVSGYDDGYYGRNTRDYSYSDDRYRNDDRYRPLPAAPPCPRHHRSTAAPIRAHPFTAAATAEATGSTRVTIADIARASTRAATTGSTMTRTIHGVRSGIATAIVATRTSTVRGVLTRTRIAMGSCGATTRAIANGIATRRGGTFVSD